MGDALAIEFLTMHKLQRLIQLFKQRDIKKQHFYMLDDSDLKDLIPNIVDRIEFKDALKQDRQTKAVQVNFTQPSPCLSTATDFRDIMQLHESGRMFLATFEKKGEYDNTSRKLIRDAMVEHYFVKGGGKIVNATFLQMRQLILDFLTKEAKETWYYPRSDKQSAGGLLYARYRYLKNIDRRFQPVKDMERKPSLEENKETASRTWTELSSKERDACCDNINCISSCSICVVVKKAAKFNLGTIGYQDSCAIINAWNDCFDLRRWEIITGTFKPSDYEVLEHFSDVHTLINLDFKRITKSEQHFSTNLPAFLSGFRNVYEERKNKITDSELNEHIIRVFTSSNDAPMNDTATLLACLALPMLLRQNHKKVGNKRVKPTLEMSRISFITIIPTEAKLADTIQQRIDDAAALKSKVQPYIIVVGSLSKINVAYVIFDSVMLQCRSITSALDLHFKIHTVLHLEYANACASVMRFIQNFFFNIMYDDDKDNADVATLIADVQRQREEEHD